MSIGRMLLSSWSPSRQRLREPGTVLSAIVLLTVVVAGLVAPLLGYEPGLDVDPSRISEGPSVSAFMGTDHLGRSVGWRLAHACRAFTLPGLLAAITALVLGVPAGAVAGWRTGLLASTVRVLLDIVSAVPRLVLVLLVCTIFGPGFVTLALAAGLAYAPTLADSIRVRVRDLRLAGHVDAWTTHGLSTQRILWLHLVALGCGRLVIRRLLELFAFVLVLETTLSYIGGFGVPEPTPSWGNMLAFDWGHDGHLVPLFAPAVALWVTLAATARVASVFAECET